MSTRKVELILPDGTPLDAKNTIPGAITITFGERVENHARMEMIGDELERGLTTKELRSAKKTLEKRYPNTNIEYLDLTEYAPDPTKVDDAAVLIIRDGVNLFGQSADQMLREHVGYDWDKHVKMYGEVRQKHARWNACYADFDQEPAYADGKGRVVDFKHLPITAALREVWPTFLPDFTENLNAEGNYYYNVNECGIGWHGDGERMVVIAIRLGVSIPLMYHWWHNGEQIGKLVEIDLAHGDIYIMSQKATGNDWENDWKKKGKAGPTLRHSAGCPNFTTYKKKK